MPSVTIDASVVDGSSTKIHPNPLLPISTAFSLPPENIGALSSPVNINPLSEGDISNANTLPSLPVATTSTPTAITANPLDAESPPFPRKHARIFYDSILLNAAVSSNVGASPSFVLIPNTAQRWTFTATTTNELVFTLPANRNIDTVCIGAHNLSGATISVEYDPAASGYVPFHADIEPVTNDAIMLHISSTVSVTKLKISITGLTGSFFVGSVYAGIALQMQRPFFGGHTPAVLARQADYYSSMSESGNFIGVEVRRRAIESSADWKNITDTWYRQYVVPFLASAETLPFYFAWNLEQYPTDVVYCKNITNIAPSYSGQRNLMTFSIPLVGIA